jgi:FtsH-binding integral membrane protein
MSDYNNAFAVSTVARERSILKNVYIWMTVGLALTGFVAHGVANNPQLMQMIFSSKIAFFGIIIAQLALVIILSACIMKMSVTVATICFTTYAALNGVTLSIVFIVYTASSIASVFFITAGTFAGMSLYAITTKRDLSGIGSYLFMGLLGLIIASVVNFFLRNTLFDFLISLAGVAIFVGLTVYDTQRIKRWNEETDATSNETLFGRLSILGALHLYLDFINLFLHLLRLLGRRN